MDQELLQRYLAGNVNDAERQRCETLLEDPNTVVQLGDEGRDSLLDALQSTEGARGSHWQSPWEDADSRLNALVSRIQRLIPRQSIGRDELQRILDPPQAEDELGRIGRYRVLEFVAGGGMGLVFKATDPALDRLVCIKVMNPLLSHHGQAKQRFDREARAASRLQHERIVTVLEVGEHRELPFLVMQLLEGESLRRRLQRDGALEPSEARRIARQIAEGLRYAHAHGYLHRDIKPDNIWLTPDGNVKLLDLGLARAMDESIDLTHSGTVVGTPCYMSPEQVQSQTLAEPSNLFSLGIVLYEMLTGISPFDRTNVFSTMMSVANDTLPVPTSEDARPIPTDLFPLVRGLLEKQPEDRLQSADEVVEILKDDHSTGQVEPRRRISSRSNGGRSWIWITLLLLLGASGFGGFIVYQANDKGTLVIEADPEVEVSLSDQVVTIRDPQTEKTYEVKIGAKPLPSGVYQLELTGAAEDVTLSSEVIVIRRGEKQLVRLSLRPPGATPDSDIAHHEPKLLIPELSLPPTDLTTIEPLNATETAQALGLTNRKRLMPGATVTEPKTLEGVTSWTIEPTSEISFSNLRISFDGTFVATFASNSIQILSDQLDTIQVIPSTDEVLDVQWSRQANVLAVLVRGELRREAFVWRLSERDAKLLRRVSVDAKSMCWTEQGDQLFFQTEQGLFFFDVGRDKGAFHPSLRSWDGSLTDRAVSNDREQIAMTMEQGVVVYSLVDGSMLQTLPSTSQARFLADGQRIIVERAAEKNRSLEVWAIEPLQRVSSSNLKISRNVDPVIGGEQEALYFSTNQARQIEIEQFSGDRPAKRVFSPDLSDIKRYAEEHHLNLEMFNFGIRALCSSEDRERFILFWGNSCAIFSANLEDELIRVSEWKLLSDKRWERLLPNGSLDDYSALTVMQVSPWSHDPRVSPFDLSVSIRKERLAYPFDSQAVHLAPEEGFWKLSPRGDLLLLANGNESGRISIRSMSTNEEVFGIALQSDQKISGVTWTDDGRFLGVVLYSAKEFNTLPGRTLNRPITRLVPQFVVVDVDKRESNVMDIVGDRELTLGLLQSSERGRGISGPRDREIRTGAIVDYTLADGKLFVFLAEYQDDVDGLPPRDWLSTLDVFDLETRQRIASQQVGPYSEISNLTADEHGVLWMATGPAPSQLNGDRRLRVADWTRPVYALFDSARDDGLRLGTPIELRSIQSVRRNLVSIDLSPTSRQAIFRESRDMSVTKPDGTADPSYQVEVKIVRLPSEPDADASLSNVFRERFAYRIGSGFVNHWHPKKSIVAWRGDCRDHFYDTESKNEQSRESTIVSFRNPSTGRMRPTDFGWLISERKALVACDFMGDSLGNWLDASRPELPYEYGTINCFIARDGSIAKTEDATELRVVTLRGNRVVTSDVDDFLEEFPELAEVQWPWDEPAQE